MSVNWVMLAESEGYIPLPGEQTLYQSPPRTTLSLQTSHHHTPSTSYSQQCKSGVTYLTNRRLIYLPSAATPAFQSFAVPILNVTDSRVTAPWFGANKWEAIIRPVSGGGIPGQHSELELVIEFKEGGAFDFASTFERLKERLKHAVDLARDSGGDVEDSSRGVRGVNINNVHLEDLPAYEESGRHQRIQDSAPMHSHSPMMGTAPSVAVVTTPPAESSAGARTESSRQERNQSPPKEPPPGYEEVQRGSIADELERQMKNSGER